MNREEDELDALKLKIIDFKQVLQDHEDNTLIEEYYYKQFKEVLKDE